MSNLNPGPITKHLTSAFLGAAFFLGAFLAAPKSSSLSSSLPCAFRALPPCSAHDACKPR